MEVSDLNLLVYLSVINSKKLEDVMVKWSGNPKDIYTEKLIIEIYENAIINITNVYYIPSIFYHYFDAKRTQRAGQYLGDKYKYSDIEVLQSTLFWIHTNIWSNEDKERLKRLKKEYIENE